MLLSNTLPPLATTNPSPLPRCGINNVDKTLQLPCPICQISFDSHGARIQHLTDTHSVPLSNVPRILDLMSMIDTSFGGAANLPQPNVAKTSSNVSNASAPSKSMKRPLSSSKSQSDNRQNASPIDLSVKKSKVQMQGIYK